MATDETLVEVFIDVETSAPHNTAAVEHSLGSASSPAPAPAVVPPVPGVSMRTSVKDNSDPNKMSTRSQLSLNSSENMQVVYRDLNFSVMIKKKDVETEKRILKNISGVFKPGRFTAIMGASGAGKTSLLNLIAGEVHSGIVGGNILVNGEAVDTQRMKQLSGFVFQDDVILDTMTSREAITMSALLRLPQEMSKEEKLHRVDEIIDLLHLRKCQDTIIGNSSVKGVSGGERKRVAMAMEMVTNPSILFLDEPTSGLDTFTAYSVIKILKSLAASGRTIIATLHQPSSEIFHLFDDLLLLADGRIMYQGSAAESVGYFARLGYPCPNFSNPADFFFMKLLNTTNTVADDHHAITKVAPTESVVEDNHSKAKTEDAAIEMKPTAQSISEENTKRIGKLLDAYDKSPEAAHIRRIVDHPAQVGISNSMVKVRSDFSTQFGYLFMRAGRNAMRNKLILRSKLFESLFMALLIGLIYLNISSRDPTSQVQDRSGSLFFLVVQNVMSSAIGVLSIFAAEKAVFQREFGAGYYNLPSYFLSKILVETPFRILFPFIMSCIIYWMVGYQANTQKFFIYSTIVILLANCGFAIGIVAACVFDDLAVALAVVPLVLLPLMVFSGLFVNSNSIPVYFNWIKYISPMKYGFEGLIMNEYHGGSFPISTANGTVNVDGQQFIDQLGLTDGLEEWSCLLVLFSMYLFLMIVAYLGLYRIVWKHSSGSLKKTSPAAHPAA